MASGNTLALFYPDDNEPPTSIFATPDRRNAHPCLDFDATADEEAVFTFVMPQHYAGGGITIFLHYGCSSATSGNAVWQTAIERIGEGSQDVDSDGFAAFNSSGAVAVPGTSGNIDIQSIAHTAGAQMDSLVAGELGRLKVRRDADDTSATDSVSGDLELYAVEIRET